jgi:hypothetical protein
MSNLDIALRLLVPGVLVQFPPPIEHGLMTNARTKRRVTGRQGNTIVFDDGATVNLPSNQAAIAFAKDRQGSSMVLLTDRQGNVLTMVVNPPTNDSLRSTAQFFALCRRGVWLLVMNNDRASRTEGLIRCTRTIGRRPGVGLTIEFGNGDWLPLPLVPTSQLKYSRGDTIDWSIHEGGIFNGRSFKISLRVVPPPAANATAGCAYAVPNSLAAHFCR